MGAAPDPTFSSLSPPQQQLVLLMRRVWCGRLSNIPIVDGMPVLSAPMTMTRLVRLRPGQEKTLRSKSQHCQLRQEVVELFRLIYSLKHGMIERLEVLHGLPTVVEFSEPLTPSLPTSTPALLH